MHRALLLPDILLSIGPYFSLKDLTAVVLVCKPWHLTFTPLIWHTLSFDTPAYITQHYYYGSSPLRTTTYKAPSAGSIEKNATLIKAITLSEGLQHSTDRVAQQAAFQYCSDIKSLTVNKKQYLSSNSSNNSNNNGQELTLWQGLALLLHRNPKVETINLTNMVPAPPEEFVLALERLECLTKFKSTGCKYDGETIARLLKTHSSTLQVLGFSCDEIIRYQQEDSLVTTIHKIALPNLKILTLEKISNTVEVDLQLRLIQQAPELISVCWDLGDYPFPGSLFCQLVLPSCPKIENVYLTAAKQDSKNLVLHSDLYLSIADPNHSHPDPHHNQKEPTPLDETLAQILDLSRITKMESTSSGFGPLSMSAIRRHSSVLSSLNFRKCAQFTSSMAQECLSTMPLLVRLSADKISQLDIIKGYESGAPWVCKGLRVLELCIVGLPSVHLEIDQDPEELQQNLAVHAKVFDQLSVLKRLIILYLGGHPSSYGSAEHVNDGLLISLDAGLSKLDMLKDLRLISLYRIPQRMTLEDAQWIQQNWESVFWIQGELNTARRRHDEIVKFFNRHNIKVHK